MFRTAPNVSPDATPDVGTTVPTSSDDLIPLSHLALDLPVPAEGWADFLGRRAIAFVPDDIGRDSIRRSDAQRLLHEQRANELRVAKLRELAEQEAVEADQLRRAQIWKGLSADAIPVGVHPAAAMLQSAKDAQPKRRTPLEEAFSGESMTFHAYPSNPDEE